MDFIYLFTSYFNNRSYIFYLHQTEALVSLLFMSKLNDETLEHVAYRFKLLGEPMRLKILQLLREKEQCVQNLVDLTGAGQANISKHLSLLTSNGILSRRKDGLHVYYFISDPTVYDICDAVCESLENNVKGLQQAFSG